MKHYVLIQDKGKLGWWAYIISSCISICETYFLQPASTSFYDKFLRLIFTHLCMLKVLHTKYSEIKKIMSRIQAIKFCEAFSTFYYNYACLTFFCI